MDMNLRKALGENSTVTSVFDSSSDALAKLATNKKYIYFLWLNVKDLKINEFTDIELPSDIVVHITKVDDGIYSGYITKNYVSEGSEIPFRFEKRTLSEVAQFLEVKQYLEPFIEENKPESTVTIPSSKGDINITINVTKSNKERKVQLRKSISKDLLETLQKSNLDVNEIVSKAGSIKDIIKSLPLEQRVNFYSRLSTQKKGKQSIDGIVKSLELPEALVSNEDIKKAREGFKILVERICKSKPMSKASRTAYSIFKNKFGPEQMKLFKKSGKQKIEKSKDQSKVSLGDLFGSQFKMMSVGESEFDSDEKSMKKSFVENPLKGFEHVNVKGSKEKK
jgi:hypothetical protein